MLSMNSGQCVTPLSRYVHGHQSGLPPISSHELLLKELVSLHPIAPWPVLDLSYEEIGTSISIAWKPPKEPNGDIIAYFVEHGVCNSESTFGVRVDASGPRYSVFRAL